MRIPVAKREWWRTLESLSERAREPETQRFPVDCVNSHSAMLLRAPAGTSEGFRHDCCLGVLREAWPPWSVHGRGKRKAKLDCRTLQ
jgi:hypothetical protein